MRKNLLRCYLLLLGIVCASTVHAENTYLFSLGLGVAPRYQGSKDYQFLPIPGISAQFDNGFFIGGNGNAGYKKTFSNGLYFSTSLSYDNGRYDKNQVGLSGSNYLRGMGRIPGSIIGSFEVGAHVFGDSTVSMTLDAPFTHTSRGVSGHFDFTVPLIQTAHNEISVTGSVHAGSGRYTQTFFGVTDEQSARSAFRPYSTKGGIDSTTLSTAWNYKISSKWSVNTVAGVSLLLGAYGDSPIVQKKTSYFGMTSVVYHY